MAVELIWDEGVGSSEEEAEHRNLLGQVEMEYNLVVAVVAVRQRTVSDDKGMELGWKG